VLAGGKQLSKHSSVYSQSIEPSFIEYKVPGLHISTVTQSEQETAQWYTWWLHIRRSMHMSDVAHSGDVT